MVTNQNHKDKVVVVVVVVVVFPARQTLVVVVVVVGICGLQCSHVISQCGPFHFKF